MTPYYVGQIKIQNTGVQLGLGYWVHDSNPVLDINNYD